MTRAMPITLAVALALIGCAHPERIKTVSKEQEALLGTYKTVLDDVRTRVRSALDESVIDYKEARLRQWVLTETGFLSSRIVRCARQPETCEGKSTRLLLDEAADYLAQGQATLFNGFCPSTWGSARKGWMRRPNEQCPSKPQEVVKQLEGLRDTLDAGLRQLAGDLVSVQQAHALIDRFLQIRVEIREEDVDAAQKTITKATAAVQDVQAAMTAIGRGGPR